jgi:branched-chain amino acid transport system substrate-binding protein
LYRHWLVFVLLSIAVIMVPACGGGAKQGNKVTTLMPISTPSQTSASTTSAPSEPVKIGAITSWSGPAAMSGIMLGEPIIKMVEKQVRDMGGILGGRGVQVVRFDNYASVPRAQAGVKKLVLDDKVSAIVWGGVNEEEIAVVADTAEESRVLFVAVGPVANPEKHRFTVSGTFECRYMEDMINLTLKAFKARTIAILADGSLNASTMLTNIKKDLQEYGVEIIDERYVPSLTNDYVSYLTQIKSEEPDVLFLDFGISEPVISIARQIMEFKQSGGWCDTKIVTFSGAESAVNSPGAQGWYLLTPWILGLDYPGSRKYVNDYQVMFGKQPLASQIYYYNCIWTAIHAIELAGTDTDLVKIAATVRSGKLEWDTPMGHAHYKLDGSSGLHPVLACIKDGKLVPVPLTGQ